MSAFVPVENPVRHDEAFEAQAERLTPAAQPGKRKLDSDAPDSNKKQRTSAPPTAREENATLKVENAALRKRLDALIAAAQNAKNLEALGMRLELKDQQLIAEMGFSKFYRQQLECELEKSEKKAQQCLATTKQLKHKLDMSYKQQQKNLADFHEKERASQEKIRQLEEKNRKLQEEKCKLQEENRKAVAEQKKIQDLATKTFKSMKTTAMYAFALRNVMEPGGLPVNGQVPTPSFDDDKESEEQDGSGYESFVDATPSPGKNTLSATPGATPGKGTFDGLSPILNGVE